LLFAINFYCKKQTEKTEPNTKEDLFIAYYRCILIIHLHALEKTKRL